MSPPFLFAIIVFVVQWNGRERPSRPDSVRGQDPRLLVDLLHHLDQGIDVLLDPLVCRVTAIKERNEMRKKTAKVGHGISRTYLS